MKATSWPSLAAACLALACALPAARAQTVRVVTEDTPQTYLQDGRVVGQATEVVELTFRRAGITDYRIDLYPWARAIDLAQREPFVMIYLIARTAERENRFRWVGEITRMKYYFYGLPERTELRIGQLDDARIWSIGVVRDDVRQEYLQRRGFTRLVVSAQPAENLRKLLNRQIDLVVLTEVEARGLCGDARAECNGLVRLMPLDDLPIGLYMAYSTSTPEDAVARMRTAFETVKADGSLLRIMGPPSVFTVAPPAPDPGPRRRPAN